MPFFAVDAAGDAHAKLGWIVVHCTMGQEVEIDILEVHKSKQILHAHL